MMLLLMVVVMRRRKNVGMSCHTTALVEHHL